MCSHAFGNTFLAASLAVLSLTHPALGQNVSQLVPQHVSLSQVVYRGRSAVRLISAPDTINGSTFAILKNVRLQDGTIEVDLAGKPAAGAPPTARGFIGIAFRLQDDQYEYIYLRPTNGRAEDQVRRNHSTQYSSHPEFDFARLRQESPEKYESYVDLQPGVWTKYKIEIDGRQARLFVQDSGQPVLIVDDLKRTPQVGGVALWIGPGTEGYFTNWKITPKTGHSLANSQH